MPGVSGMFETHPLVLSIRSAGFKDMDPCNVDEIHNIWNAFSKAKNCIDGGDRFEYLSWRIYSRELLRIKNSCEPIIVGSEHEPECVEDSHQQHPEQSDSESNSDSDWDDANTEDNQSSAHISLTNPRSSSKLSRNSSAYSMRRISSVELQHMFKNNSAPQANVALKAKKAKHIAKHPRQMPRRVRNMATSIEREVVAEESDEEAETPIAEMLKYERPRITKPWGNFHSRMPPLRTWEHSQISQHRLSLQDHSPSPGLSQKECAAGFRRHSLQETSMAPPPSPVVRGFDLSSVSVSINHHMGEPKSASPEPQSPKTEMPLQTPNSLAPSTPQQVTDVPAGAAKSRQNMFFFQAGETDSESSSTGSYECVSGKPAEEDEWDDISADEEDSIDAGASLSNNEDDEQRMRAMFQEREVPETPQLKRSLLSSLILDKMKNGTATPTTTKSGATSPPTRPNTAQLVSDFPLSQSVSTAALPGTASAMPLDQINGVDITPKFTAMRASPKTATSVTTRWGGDSDHVRGSVSRPRGALSRTQSALAAPRESVLSPSDSQTHITARPEMYRAATTSQVGNLDEDKFNASNWSNQHEDIYDPMNYHSRGW